MCCDICPLYEECEEAGKVKDKCCSECPDWENCIGAEEEKVNDEDEEELSI